MELRRLTVCLVSIALLAACGAGSWAQEPIKDQAKCYTTWDASYLYTAFKVECPDIRGDHKAPNADVTGDDSVTIFIRTGDKRSSAIDPNCFSMTVSAAGGAQFKVGSDKGTLDPVSVWTFKYGATVQGTVNNGDDVDLSYTIEVAIPWELIKMKPPVVGDMISANILIRSHGEKGGFVSLSPKVVSEADTLDPAKWMPTVLAAYSFGATMPGNEKLISPKSIVRAPLINGTIGEGEWSNNSSFSMALPAPAGFVYEAKYPIQRAVLSPYYYWYQADPKRASPNDHILDETGRVILSSFPAKSIGPWFSYDRVQWHKEQLADAEAAGVDVLLPVYRGDKSSRAGYAAKGLDCLVAALSEMVVEGRAHPKVGMLFDVDSLNAAYGQVADLSSEEAKRAFYGMIEDFFDRVPVEHRAFAQAGKPNAGRPGFVVCLASTGEIPNGFDDGVIAYCNERFEKDFGCPVVWVAGDGFAGKSQTFDGAVSLKMGPDAAFEDSGRIKTATVCPGFGPWAGTMLARMNGDLYQKQWESVLARQTHWVVCNSWNDFTRGTEICANREYGRKFIDATGAAVKRLSGSKDFDVRYLRCDLPRVLSPKRIVQAEVVLKNTGSLPWRVSDGIGLAYRWYRSGRYFAESKVRRPLERDIAPGGAVTLNIGVATVDMQNTAIPDGDYELRFELMRFADNKWFSAAGVQPLIVPVTVGPAPEWKATYLSCDLPNMVASACEYGVTVRVRNDGTKPWPKGVAKLGCKLFRVSNYTHDNPNDAAEEVPIKDARVLLSKDCNPGEIVELPLVVNLTQADKKPVASWTQSDDWSYQLRFDIYNGTNWLTELGSPALSRIVDVFEVDYGPRIVDSSVPERIAAGQVFDAKVVIRNTGAVKWDRKKTRIGYHWFHVDGTLMQWDCPASPIAADIKPGWPVVVTAKIKAPEYDGQYVLTWDVQIGDTWLSTLPLSRGGDMLPVFVEVTGGRLAFADLSGVCDVNASSPDTSRNSGDFDGKGSSLPAELMPPDVGISTCPVYPSGYQWDREPRADGRVSFRYPDKLPGTKSAVACNGQKLTFEHGKYTAAYILGASSGGKVSGELSLNYTDGASPASLTMNDWLANPEPSDVVGRAFGYRHSHGGDELGKPAYLFDYRVELDSSRALTSITLPKSKDMKIVAITLERAALPAPAAEEKPAKK